MKKIFISYTFMDGQINKKFLLNLEQKIKLICEVYIDILHNDSFNKQQRVFSELRKSDMLFLVKTNKIKESIWVKKEILMAKKEKIPIYKFEYLELIEKEFQPMIKRIDLISNL